MQCRVLEKNYVPGRTKPDLSYIALLRKLKKNVSVGS
jgi:hypothetical protein